MVAARPDYESTEWADVVPIPQNEGTANPLAAIAYTEEYSQASDYLRAVMALNEKSPRALALTEHIISMNPAHYTVWIYRASMLDTLQRSADTELKWLTATSMKNLKNYQIWQHRQVVMTKLSALPEGETKFLADVLAKDTKNYHVWSYRQWLVKHFKLWAEDGSAGAAELEYAENMLKQDVRNNSAWNHRYFVLFKKPGRASLPEETVEREVHFAKEAVRQAPQNQSSWNYLKGVLRWAKRPESEIKEFALLFADIETDKVDSSHALDTLADIWAKEKDTLHAGKALELLGEKYDPIRKNYWEWRKSQLQTAAA